jgi:hypothetical protein
MLDQESPALRGFFVECVTKQAIFIPNYVAVSTLYIFELLIFYNSKNRYKNNEICTSAQIFSC